MNNYTLDNITYLYWYAPIFLFLLLRLKNNLTSKSIISFIVKNIIVLSLILSLCNFSKTNSINENQVSVFLDVSNSINEKEIDSLISKAKTALKSEDINIISFAKVIKKDTSKDHRSSFNNSERDETNLENLIEQYQGLELVILTDGNETKGNILSKLDSSLSSIAPIHFFTPDRESKKEENLTIKPLAYPKIYYSQNSTNISFVIKNNSKENSSGKIVVNQNNEIIKEISSQIKSKSSEVFKVKTKNLDKGINKFNIKYKNNLEDRELNLYITSKEKEKILLLSSSSEESKTLENVLKNQALTIESINTSKRKLSDELKLKDFQLIIINNVPLKDLNPNFGNKLENYVARGGSFLMLGGNKSFGLGGYKNTVFETILPVNLLTPQKIQKRLNVAVELVLDKSGSMKNRSKMDYTKLAAKSVIGALKDDDYFGLIGFDSQPFIALEIAKLGNGGRLKASQRVGLIFPNGNTQLFPAMDAAKSQLEKAKAGRKHMIILTDGKLPDGVVMRSRYIDLADQLRRTGITVSTFLISPDNSSILKEIAKAGGGKFHKTQNAQTLPRLFLEDVKINTAEKTQKEYATYNVDRAKKEPKATKLDYFPSLLGYVETKIKDKAYEELSVESQNKDPLLAHWNYKKGKSMAFTSDASPRWSKRWLEWNKYYQFWSDIVGFLTNDNSQLSDDFNLNYKIIGSELIVDTNFYNEEIKSSLLDATIDYSNNTTSNLLFKSKAKGLFEARTTVTSTGVAKLKLKIEGNKSYEFLIDIPESKFSENNNKEINFPLLHKVASITGGKVNPDTLELNSNYQAKIKKESYAFYLLILALFLILIDIILRERS